MRENENVCCLPRLWVQAVKSWRRLKHRNLLPEMQGKNDYRNQGRQNNYSKDIRE